MQTVQNCVNTLISSSFKQKSCPFQACPSLMQAQIFLMGQSGWCRQLQWLEAKMHSMYCKTYTKRIPVPKLLYAKYFPGESCDDSYFLIIEMYALLISEETAKRLRATSHSHQAGKLFRNAAMPRTNFSIKNNAAMPTKKSDLRRRSSSLSA